MGVTVDRGPHDPTRSEACHLHLNGEVTLDGGSADDESGSSLWTPAARWAALRPHLHIGAMFWIKDADVIPNSNSGKSHPYVVIGGVPPTTDRPRTALGRSIQLCCRYSYKPDRYGLVPTTEVDMQRLLRGGLVFSRRDITLGLDADGVFPRDQRTIPAADLAGARFLGWLPREVIDLVAFRMDKPMTRAPYPPVAAS